MFKEKYPDVTPKVFECVSPLFFVQGFNYRTRLDERDDGDEIQDYLLEKTKQRTVPNIFVGPYPASFRMYFFKLTTSLSLVAQEHIGGDLKNYTPLNILLIMIMIVFR